MPLQPQEVGRLEALGGHMLAEDLWDALACMPREKMLIERRLVLPLADPDLAEGFGVLPPRAVALFGPPGTGKTTFAKAVASRLRWPFVEVLPSRLAAEGPGLALALRDTFAEIAELQHAVVFIDEVEEITAERGGRPPSPMGHFARQPGRAASTGQVSTTSSSGHRTHPCPASPEKTRCERQVPPPPRRGPTARRFR